jgi:predicted HAD superfamily Cof-like phosphohydrolase
MTDKMIQDIADFHEKFGLEGPTRPTLGDRELIDFRVKFMNEELREFTDAIDIGSITDAFDALIDLTYVVLGTAHMMGLPFQAGWDAVHEANMQKQKASADGSDSKRGSRFDVIKPEGWQPPDLVKVLAAQELSNISNCRVCWTVVEKGIPHQCKSWNVENCKVCGIIKALGEQCDHLGIAAPVPTQDFNVEEPPQENEVRHQNYYKGRTGMEVIDVIQEFELTFEEGNLIKYILRHKKKGQPLKDLKKAAEYLDMVRATAERNEVDKK